MRTEDLEPGAWNLDSSSRLTRPVIVAGLATACVSLLMSVFLEMGNQL